MKKRVICCLICVITMLLSSCYFDDTPAAKEQWLEASKDDTSSESEQEEQSGGEREGQTFGLKETAVFNNLKFTAIDIAESYGDSFFQPESGNIFVGIKFEIENISAEEQSVSSALMFDSYVDDIKCSYSISANCVFTDGTIDGTLTPGKKLIGWYGIEVPQQWSEIELVVKPDWISLSDAHFVFKK